MLTIRPLGQKSLTVYDAVGNPIRTTDFNGEVILYQYNETDQLTQKEFADGSTVQLSYEEGQLTQVIDERGTTE